MSQFFSPLMGGFYTPEVHGDAIPADAVPVTDAEHAALLAGQAAGKIIAPGPDGAPVLIDPPQPTEAERLGAWRAAAYLDRGTFVRTLRAEGILPASEAVIAAKGDWPTTFADALATLPVDPVDAQIDWAAAAGVSRVNPLFLAVLGFYAQANSLTEAEAAALGDRIFGWVETPAAPD